MLKIRCGMQLSSPPSLPPIFSPLNTGMGQAPPITAVHPMFMKSILQLYVQELGFVFQHQGSFVKGMR